ncbi:glycosyltransferase [Palleniella muris]|uniref:Glycosyltransferase n=1 Tax=Palleniella muris TaxID=3038145 RepID=A0AC61QQ76_9BACT|nr:glycosyltransferase family 4 protein [Palleniella muris]TGX82099.1 glycosyltransferase [Palleniella muris]
MNLIFLQNCVSPHQMPYIEELPQMQGIDRVVVISPRVDYDDRKEMGWQAEDLMKSERVEFVIAPAIEQVESLFDEIQEQDTYCFFSGINAFPEIVPWMKLSLKYDFKRGIITEPPLLYSHPLWQHKLRFILKDWHYVKYFNNVFVMGDAFVSYYKKWNKRWKVSPFMYCTKWKSRTMPAPATDKLKILYVGSLSDRKHVAWAMKTLIKYGNIEIGIVGDGEERAVIEQMLPSAKAKIMMHGMQPMEKIPEYMQQYDVLILPSKHDGWGAVVNEALTLGLYVICSNHCGAAYLLQDKQQGLVFGLDDNFSLQAVIEQCISQKNWIRNTVEQRITWSKAHISGKAVAQYFIEQLV